MTDAAEDNLHAVLLLTCRTASGLEQACKSHKNSTFCVSCA